MRASSTCNRRTGGVTPRYRGIGPPIMQKTICTSLMFGTYDFYRRLLLLVKQHHSACLPESGLRGSSSTEETVFIRLLASSCSGLTEALLTPFERVQTLMQIPEIQRQLQEFLRGVQADGSPGVLHRVQCHRSPQHAGQRIVPLLPRAGAEAPPALVERCRESISFAPPLTLPSPAD